MPDPEGRFKNLIGSGVFLQAIQFPLIYGCDGNIIRPLDYEKISDEANVARLSTQGLK